MKTRNLKIQDGEDVDVPRRPGIDSYLNEFYFTWLNIMLSRYESDDSSLP